MDKTVDAKVRRALGLIQEGDDGPFTWSEFDRLHTDILVGDVKKQAEREIRLNLSNVHQDLWNLLSIVAKVEWLHSLHARGEVSQGLYMSFATSDIDLFVVQLRATFNEVARVIDKAANKPGQIPDRFGRLVTWLNASAERAAGVIGIQSEELTSQLNEELAWFEDVRAIRDSMLYKGGQTIVFPNTDEILFQVHERRRNRVAGPFMYNENVADFRRFAVMHVLLLMDFLERLAIVLRGMLSIPEEAQLGGANMHFGFGTLKEWAGRLLDAGSTPED